MSAMQHMRLSLLFRSRHRVAHRLAHSMLAALQAQVAKHLLGSRAGWGFAFVASPN